MGPSFALFLREESTRMSSFNRFIAFAIAILAPGFSPLLADVGPDSPDRSMVLDASAGAGQINGHGVARLELNYRGGIELLKFRNKAHHFRIFPRANASLTLDADRQNSGHNIDLTLADVGLSINAVDSSLDHRDDQFMDYGAGYIGLVSQSDKTLNSSFNGVSVALPGLGIFNKTRVRPASHIRGGVDARFDFLIGNGKLLGETTHFLQRFNAGADLAVDLGKSIGILSQDVLLEMLGAEEANGGTLGLKSTTALENVAGLPLDIVYQYEKKAAEVGNTLGSDIPYASRDVTTHILSLRAAE